MCCGWKDMPALSCHFCRTKRRATEASAVGLEVVGLLVALAVHVLELVAELQVGGLGDGFAVGQLGAVVEVLGGGVDVLVADEDGVARAQVVQQFEVASLRHGVLAVDVVAVAEASAEGDVAPPVVELAVGLQGGVGADVLAVGQGAAVDGVDADVLQRVVVHGQLLKREVVVGVVHQVVGVALEGARLRVRQVVRLAVREVGSEDDVGQRVRPPLHAEVGMEALAAVARVGVGVGKGVTAGQEVFGGPDADHVVARIVVAGASAEVYFLGFGGEVHAHPFAGVQAVVAPPAGASSAAGESLVVDVVHRANDGHLRGAAEVVDHGARRIAVFGAGVHLLLHGQVEDGFFFAVVDAGNARQVGLLVIGLQFVDHLDGQVLQGGGYVAAEEFLAVDHHLGYVLSVDFHVSVVVNLGSGQFLHQLFQHGSLRGAVGRRVELYGVFHYLHLGRFGHHHSFGQQDGVGLQHGVAHPLRGGRQLHEHQLGVVSHVGHFQHILSRPGLQAVVSLGGGGHAGGLRAVRQAQQLHAGGNGRQVGVTLHDSAAHVHGLALRECGQCPHPEQDCPRNQSFHLCLFLFLP